MGNPVSPILNTGHLWRPATATVNSNTQITVPYAFGAQQDPSLLLAIMCQIQIFSFTSPVITATYGGIACEIFTQGSNGAGTISGRYWTTVICRPASGATFANSNFVIAVAGGSGTGVEACAAATAKGVDPSLPITVVKSNVGALSPALYSMTLPITAPGNSLLCSQALVGESGGDLATASPAGFTDDSFFESGGSPYTLGWLPVPSAATISVVQQSTFAIANQDGVGLVFELPALRDPTITLAVDPVNGVDALLTWTDTSTVDATFQIYRDGVLIATVGAPGFPVSAYLDRNLNPTQTYTYKVIGNASGVSNIVTVTMPAGDPSDTFNCDCEAVSPYDTLANVRRKMLIRMGYPNQLTNPPPGMATLVDQFLRDAQDEIYLQLQRAALRTERFFRWTMVPGQRYYGFDEQDTESCASRLNPYKVTWVGFEDLNQAWYRLDEGIPPEYYTRANINFGWPTRFEIRSCIEIFPAPQAAYTLWIKGDFGVEPLVADSDRFTIDDKAVYLLALGNAKAHYGQKDAQLVLTQAGNYSKSLVAGSHGTRRYVPRSETENPLTPPKFLPLGNGQA